MVKVIRRKTRRALGRSNLPGIDYTLNPYIGCMHGCVYCYSRLYCPKEVGTNWGEVVVVKSNIAEVLRREIRRKSKGKIALSTLTDAYQPVERDEKITRKLLQMLLNSGFSVSIQTKSDLVLRDADIITSHSVDVGFTITTLDDGLAKVVEPGAPAPSKRVRALERLHSEGVKTWIFLGPILPGAEDDVETIVELARATDSILVYDKYRVKKFMNSGIEGELAERAKKMDWKVLARKIEKLYDRAFPAFGDRVLP